MNHISLNDSDTNVINVHIIQNPSIGGLYFIISRSIGPEFGASMGILLALANTISVALNTFGFCLSFRSLLNSFDIHILNTNFGFLLTGFIAILIMGALCGVGMDDEAKVSIKYKLFIDG